MELRCYQERLVNKTIGEVGNSHSVLLQSPTGSGKTIMGLAIASRLKESGLDRIAWVSHRREILNQVRVEIKTHGFDLEVIPVSIFASKVPHCDVMISDECHHDCTASTVNVYTQMRPKFLVGLTATPERTDRMGLSFQKQFNDFGINELIKLGYLSKYNHFIIRKYTPEDVARAYLDNISLFGKSVIFFNTQAECLAIQNILLSAGVRAAAVLHNSNRGEILPSFHNGDLDVLISIRILTEGYNDPTINTVFVRPSTKHCTVQMAGRLFRKNGDVIKNLVQCQNTEYNFARHARPERSFVLSDGVWAEMQGKNLEPVIHAAVRKLLRVDVKELPQPKAYKLGRRK